MPTNIASSSAGVRRASAARTATSRSSRPWASAPMRRAADDVGGALEGVDGAEERGQLGLARALAARGRAARPPWSRDARPPRGRSTERPRRLGEESARGHDARVTRRWRGGAAGAAPSRPGATGRVARGGDRDGVPSMADGECGPVLRPVAPIVSSAARTLVMSVASSASPRCAAGVAVTPLHAAHLAASAGHAGNPCSAGGALEPMRDDEQLVRRALPARARRRQPADAVLEGGEGVPRLHEEDRSAGTPDRCPHRRPVDCPLRPPA